METEWYYLADRREVMVNVTDIYACQELANLLEEIGVEYSWTGVQFVSRRIESELVEWMFLLGATECSIDLSAGDRSGDDSGSPPTAT